jgi:general secretion pathway protein B
VSLILDALKKSEQERRRERGPDLQSIHQSTVAVPVPPRRGWWALAAAVVLLNAAALGWWWWRDAAEPAAAAAAVPPESAAPQPEVPADPPPAPSPAATAAVEPAEFATVAPAREPPVQELWELPEPVRRQLPAMTYSFHVYASDPSRRTIIINNQRMREGSEIQPGLRLEAITEDGVILATEGHRVHIAVLEGW